MVSVSQKVSLSLLRPISPRLLTSELAETLTTSIFVKYHLTCCLFFLNRALVRPGRFDKTVAVPLPDIVGRRQIIEAYMKEVSGERMLFIEQVTFAGFLTASFKYIFGRSLVLPRSMRSYWLGVLQGFRAPT